MYHFKLLALPLSKKTGPMHLQARSITHVFLDIFGLNESMREKLTIAIELQYLNVFLPKPPQLYLH